jgi:broad specificity phosphatase PhoE
VNARLTLVAHASTAATARAVFASDEGLEPRGAAAAAAATRPRRVTRAVCSPARAAVETAAALGLAATVDAGLADWDLGAWRGRALDEVAADHPAEVAAWLGDPDAVPHGGESLTALLARVGDWLAGADVVAKPGGSQGGGGAVGAGGSAGAAGSAAGAGSTGGAAVGHTVAVTHAAVVRAAVVVTLGAPAAGFWRIDVAPLTATVLRGGPGRWTVRGTALPLDASTGGR